MKTGPKHFRSSWNQFWQKGKKKKKGQETARGAERRRSSQRDFPKETYRTRRERHFDKERRSPDTRRRDGAGDYRRRRRTEERARMARRSLEAREPKSEYERFLEFRRFQEMSHNFNKEQYFDPAHGRNQALQHYGASYY